MKKQIAITAAAFLIIALATISAHAGSARRHTVETILIGTGVTLLGTAIAHSINHPEPVRVKTVHYRQNKRYAKIHKKHRKGHWKKRKVWVKPEYKTRWNPGHYNKRGKWLRGRHQEFMISKGHWERQRVWVRHDRRF